jgi:hypothetical protein
MKTTIVAALLTVSLAGSLLWAQEPQPAAGVIPTTAQPTKEHEWLKKLVGQWDAESEMTPGPGQASMSCKSVINTRMLGELWVVTDLKTDAAGGSVSALQTIGFDPKKGKFVGTWIDSMSDHMWHYEGWLDETGKILTLEAEGPNFLGGEKLTKYRDIYELQSDGHLVMKSTALGDDGKWVTFVSGKAHRK